jgi:hypothetical protein
MQYVPFRLAQELWNATPERNWSALRDRVHERVEKEEDFEGVSPTTLLQSINRLAHIGAEYPDSPQELFRILDQQVHQLAD